MLVTNLGLTDYQSVWHDMRDYTHNRNADDADQLWITQHLPIYTRGTSCSDVPDFPASHIPVIDSDRGGQLTYHGPGQLIVYLLLDIKRLGMGPKRLVHSIEEAVQLSLKDLGHDSHLQNGAPGVYVNHEKIAALGLRIHKGCCYHGLSLNVDMDLRPYDWISPCGFADLQMTSLAKLGPSVEMVKCEAILVQHLQRALQSGEVKPA